MENKIWIGALFLVVVSIFLSSVVHAECDEERIRLSISDLIVSKVAEIGVNTDNSFRAYEQFNTKQLGDTIANINKVMQQGAYTALIALFGMVFLSLSIWSLIKMKQEKNILMTMLNEMRDERKAHALVIDKLAEFMLQKVQAQPVYQQVQVQAQQQFQQEIPVPIPPKKEKRGFLGLFKGRKKDEQAPVLTQQPQPQMQLQPVQMRAQVYDAQAIQQEQSFQELQQQLLEKYELDQQQKALMQYQAQQAQLRQQAQQQVYADMQKRELERMQAEQDVKRIALELEEKKKALLDLYQKKPRVKHGTPDSTGQASVGLGQDAGNSGSSRSA